MHLIKRFIHDNQAATAVEYAVMLLLIFLVCLAAISIFGQATSDNMSESADALKSALD